MFDDRQLDPLCDALAARADQVNSAADWPGEQLAICAKHGVLNWFLPVEFGGAGWPEVDLLRAYMRMSSACLTTPFILTQFTAACRRITDSENESLKRDWLPAVLDGSRFITVGISHLTTSRRHLAQPAMRAEPTGDGFELNGYSPWVTGAIHADGIVLGATLADGQQILCLLPTDLPGVSVKPPLELVGLSASCTGAMECHGTRIGREMLIAGPAENVMQGKTGGATGGLQTSALAIGHAAGAIRFLADEAQRRPDLQAAAASLDAEQKQLQSDLLALAIGEPACTNESLRARANSLALRAAQSALAAAKGTGYVAGHPAGRRCREAIFFLVWSCPQPVTAANLCELAGLESFGA